MKQRNIFLTALIVMFALTLTSCSTSQTFTVQGTPGTIITTPQNQQVAVIDNSGTAKVEIKRNMGYLHYLQAQAPGTSVTVPFALDYKNNGSRAISRGAGQGIISVGAIVALGGGLGLLLGGDAAMTPGAIMVGGGAALALSGCALGAANDPIKYDYDYEKVQSANNDIVK